MSTRKHCLRYVLTLAGSALLCTAALSEEVQPPAQLDVHAERPFVTVSKQQGGVVPVTQYEVQYRVSYADLNLSKRVDVDTLRSRVRDAARAACQDIDAIGHFKEPDPACSERAETRAREQVDAAIAGLWPTPYAAQPGEGEIVVHAERMSAKVVTGPSVGIPITEYALRYRVSYADLDLATPNGIAELKKRVHDAAESACKDIDKLNRFPDSDPACAHKAEAGAMSEVDAAVAAAHERA